jgi:hypothetical protein
MLLGAIPPELRGRGGGLRLGAVSTVEREPSDPV